MKSIIRSTSIFCLLVIINSTVGYTQIDSTISFTPKTTFHFTAQKAVRTSPVKYLNTSVDWNSLKKPSRFALDYNYLVYKKPQGKHDFMNSLMFGSAAGLSPLLVNKPTAYYDVDSPIKFVGFAMGVLTGGIISGLADKK